MACALDSQRAAAAETHGPFNKEALPCCRSVLQTQAVTCHVALKIENFPSGVMQMGASSQKSFDIERLKKILLSLGRLNFASQDRMHHLLWLRHA